MNFNELLRASVFTNIYMGNCFKIMNDFHFLVRLFQKANQLMTGEKTVWLNLYQAELYIC